MTALDDAGLPSYRAPFLVALAVIASLCATFGGWSMFARLDSAVVIQGVLLAESQRKTVEHLEGGILKRLLVKPGDTVAIGQTVAQLDATQTEEQLAQIEANRLGLAFDIWRLEAEEAGTPLDPAAAPAAPDAQRAKLVAAQLALFDARQRAHVGQIAALRRQIDQLRAQRTANLAQATAADRQLASWTEERALNATLVDKGATPRQKLLEIDRTLALLEGEREENRGLAAAALEDIARAEADIETARQQRLVEVGERLSEARRQVAGLTAQARGAEDVLERRNLRAPQAGKVVEIRTVTPGAVVLSGAPVMEIVPDGDRLVASLRLPLELDRHRPRRASRQGQAHRLSPREGAGGGWRGDLRLGRPHRGRARRLLLLRGAGQPRPGEPGADAGGHAGGGHAGRGVDPDRRAPGRRLLRRAAVPPPRPRAPGRVSGPWAFTLR